jgi:cell division protein FtsW (lipid II flippase)
VTNAGCCDRVTTYEERRHRKELSRERTGIVEPPSIAALIRLFFIVLLLGEAMVWGARYFRPHRNATLEQYLRDTWVVAGGCLVFLLVMLVLRYRRIRADELTDTAACQGARGTQTRVDQ